MTVLPTTAATALNLVESARTSWLETSEHMNIALWILAGGLVGWIAYAKLRANAHRGIVFSVAVGMIGAFVGGHVLAPLFANAASAADVFSPFALVLASVSAIVCLACSEMIYQRFDL